LLCRKDPDPMPTLLGQHLVQRFTGPKARENTDAFIADMRARQLAFYIHTYRHASFPGPIKEFWDQHYVPYVASLWVAGRRIRGAAGTAVDMDVVVPGQYRWFTRYGAHVTVDDKELAPGDTIDLGVGIHRLVLRGATGDGMLTYAIDRPPWPSFASFYDDAMFTEMLAFRPTWW